MNTVPALRVSSRGYLAKSKKAIAKARDAMPSIPLLDAEALSRTAEARTPQHKWEAKICSLCNCGFYEISPDKNTIANPKSEGQGMLSLQLQGVPLLPVLRKAGG